jgi:hypothetical protein
MTLASSRLEDPLTGDRSVRRWYAGGPQVEEPPRGDHHDGEALTTDGRGQTHADVSLPKDFDR